MSNINVQSIKHALLAAALACTFAAMRAEPAAAGTVLAPIPCVTSVHSDKFGDFNIAGKDLSKNLTLPVTVKLVSCSSLTQSVVIQFVDHDSLPITNPPSRPECLLPNFSSAVITLKPGETRTITTQSPTIGQSPCLIQHIFSADVVQQGTNTILTSDWMVVAVSSRF